MPPWYLKYFSKYGPNSNRGQSEKMPKSPSKRIQNIFNQAGAVVHMLRVSAILSYEFTAKKPTLKK